MSSFEKLQFCYNVHMSIDRIVYSGKCNGVEIVIRYPVIKDIEKLLEFINTASKEQTFILPQGEQFTFEEETKYVDDFIKKIEDKRAVKLLAFQEDELIGVADVYLKDKVEKHVGVFGIIIVPKWRGKGVGTLLLKQTLAEAEKHIRSVRIITLGVFGNNAIAKKLYEKMGFVEYGKLKEGIQHRGEFVDHIYMFKKIQNGTR